MLKWPYLIFISFCLIFSVNVRAIDTDVSVAGAEVEDVLKNKDSEVGKSDPYLIEQGFNELEKVNLPPGREFSIPEADHEFDNRVSAKSKIKDSGFAVPSTMEGNENYQEIDKKQMSYEFRRLSEGGINIAYFKNQFQYESPRDIINQTVGSGYKHVKGGSIEIRSDQYLFHTMLLNSFWSLGAGVGYNSGRGIFVTGERSDMTFRLWEVPVDLGLGLEVPIYHWFKIVGVAGPSVMALNQNRSDFNNNEKGKSKTQVSYGKFANAQFKINLTGFSSDYAHELFSKSSITNLFLNIEARYHIYQNFQDQIKISGTSLGLGFTFEYL